MWPLLVKMVDIEEQIQLSDKLVIYELTWKESLESNSSPKSSEEEKRSSKSDVSDSRRCLKDGEEVDEEAAGGGGGERRRRRGRRGSERAVENNVPSEEVERSDKLQERVRMHYKVCSRIGQKFECTLMVVGSNCVVLCQKRRLQCINFEGKLEREWTVDSHICYVRFTGGPSGKEGLLIGLKNGRIVQIFVSNPFPISMIQVDAAVVCLDLSPNRKELAVVDERGFCSVFDVREKKLLYEASSVSTNQFSLSPSLPLKKSHSEQCARDVDSSQVDGERERTINR